MGAELPRRRAEHGRFEPEEGELFFGLAGAIGTDFDLLSQQLEASLAVVGYKSHTVHISKLLKGLEGHDVELVESPYEKKIETHMDAGNKLRRYVGHGGALALQAVAYIRQVLREESDKVAPKTAYVLRSLKHPEEVTLLRGIYGESFHLISAYSPESSRIQALSEKIANSVGHGKGESHRAIAHLLSQRDEEETDEFGQKLRKTFPKADVIVNASDPALLRAELDRYIQIVFGHPYHTPMKEELGMFHAYGAGVRSSDLARQVGAAIVDPTGAVIATGCNEVPRFGGGQYWEGEHPDRRDFVLGQSSSEHMRRVILSQILGELQKGKWFEDTDRATLDTESLVKGALPLLKGATIRDLNEFGRPVHAEMAAILDAGRRGQSVQGCTLFSTTFPCHECTRHIIMAGITRVVYNEPYPKSYAEVLHKDAIVVDPHAVIKDRIAIQPFVGVTHRKFLDLFVMVDERKDAEGKTVRWRGSTAAPRYRRHPNLYLFQEERALALLSSKLKPKGDSSNTTGQVSS